MTRAVKEWIGKSDNSQPPPSCKDRVLKRQDDKCASCGIQLGEVMRPEFDHVIALVNGGENREGNLQALCRPCHGEKTKGDVAEKAKVAHTRKKRFGLNRDRPKIQSRGFGKSEPQRKATRPLNKPLPPRRGIE